MYRLDERDIQILVILQKEGRITKTSLAGRLNLSLTPSWDRLQRLEEAGVIENYGARLSSEFLSNFHLVITEVELESHKEGKFARFENAIMEFEEVLSCWSVGGSSDYILKILSTYFLLNLYVEMAGFEPTIPCSQSKCDTGLRYISL